MNKNLRNIVMLSVLLLIVLGVFTFWFDSKEIEQTDCYDNNGNKIIGLTCEGIVFNEFEETLLFFMPLGIVVIAVLIFSFLIRWDNE